DTDEGGDSEPGDEPNEGPQGDSTVGDSAGGSSGGGDDSSTAKKPSTDSSPPEQEKKPNVTNGTDESGDEGASKRKSKSGSTTEPTPTTKSNPKSESAPRAHALVAPNLAVVPYSQGSVPIGGIQARMHGQSATGASDDACLTYA